MSHGMKVPTAQAVDLLCDADLAALAKGRLRALHGRKWPLWGDLLPRAEYLVNEHGTVTGPYKLPVPASKGWAWWG